MTAPVKNTVCLWYDGSAEEAARFYAATFPDSAVGAVYRAPGDFQSGKKGRSRSRRASRGYRAAGCPCLPKCRRPISSSIRRMSGFSPAGTPPNSR